MDTVMDVKNINAFTEVIVSTFETSCNEAPFRYTDYQKIDGSITNDQDLMCVVEFSGSLSGSIIMNFPAATANKVYGAMMMEDVSEFSEEVAEGFTEIINMVIGNVTANLTDHKLDVKKTECLPEKGKVYEQPDKLPWLKIPMSFETLGPFDLYIAMKEV